MKGANSAASNAPQADSREKRDLNVTHLQSDLLFKDKKAVKIGIFFNENNLVGEEGLEPSKS